MIKITIEADDKGELRDALEFLLHTSIPEKSLEERRKIMMDSFERFQITLPPDWKMTRDKMHER